MAGNNCLPSLGRVKLSDLSPIEGLPSDSYKLSVSTLTQSLAQYSAAIIQFPKSDAALLRAALDSARLYFHQKSTYPTSNDLIPTTAATDDHHDHHDHHDQPRDWCKTSGYYSDAESWQEVYDYRPGVTPSEVSPAGLADTFALLGKAARDVLDAIGFFLNLRSMPFVEILDNVPLRAREASSSVLSVCRHARPSFHDDNGQLVILTDPTSDHHDQVDKSLISLVKSDKAGLHVKDFQGRWVLVDEDLGPQEAVVYPGLALYQATAGYVNPALHRTEPAGGSLQSNHLFGQCSLAFKLNPRSMASLGCSEMRAAGHGVDAQFQIPIPVDDFMQRSHPTDQIFNRHNAYSSNFNTIPDGSSMKPPARRRKSETRSKHLPPSKRLRLEAQRVLKERVQDIADKKGIKLRFCNLKECETHIHTLDSPCAGVRLEIGWPHGVPFVHPHDLPNKAKMGFLEAYEPGWTANHDIELSLTEAGQHSAN